MHVYIYIYIERERERDCCIKGESARARGETPPTDEKSEPPTPTRAPDTVNLRTSIMDFRGFDSSIT